MLSFAHSVLSAPLCAARSLSGMRPWRVGGSLASSQPAPSPRQSSARGRLITSASASAAQPSPSPPSHNFGLRIHWDAEKDGDVINAETMCSAFARAGFPRTKTLNFPAVHALKDHSHNKRGYKRVGVAQGGKFMIRPKSWSGEGAEEAEAEVPLASMNDVELSVGDHVDIPPGLVHSAWVVGDEGVVFIMGDEDE